MSHVLETLLQRLLASVAYFLFFFRPEKLDFWVPQVKTNDLWVRSVTFGISGSVLLIVLGIAT